MDDGQGGAVFNMLDVLQARWREMAPVRAYPTFAWIRHLLSAMRGRGKRANETRQSYHLRFVVSILAFYTLSSSPPPRSFRPQHPSRQRESQLPRGSGPLPGFVLREH